MWIGGCACTSLVSRRVSVGFCGSPSFRCAPSAHGQPEAQYRRGWRRAMGKGEQVERVDIDVEALAFVPGEHVDHVFSPRRILTAVQQGAHAAALERAMLAGGS